MSKVHSTKPGTICSRCDKPATILAWETNFCAVHYRFYQMRRSARRLGKAVPTEQELTSLLVPISADGMKCPVCKRVMNWLYKDGRPTVITLQHDRSGPMRLICKGCNSRHAQHPGDTYYDLPNGHKRCPTCETVKTHSEFYFNRTVNALASKCRECSRAAAKANKNYGSDERRAKHREWYTAHKEKIRLQRMALYKARKDERERIQRETGE